MQDYVLIQSQSGRNAVDVGDCADLAQALAGRGHKVTLLLLQNGVFDARRGAVAGALDAVQQAGVTVLADEFSLRERGIRNGQIKPGIASTSLDFVIDRLAAGDKVVWN